MAALGSSRHRRLGAWWAMRARSGDPSVAVFWQEVDSFCLARERIHLTGDDAGDLPAPTDVAEFEVMTRGYRETAARPSR